METTKSDIDTIRSMLVLAAGILTFSAVAWNIINSKLQKARSVAAKERIIGTTLGFIATGLMASGGLAIAFPASKLIGFFLSLAGFIVMAFGYARVPAVPSRSETLNVIVASAVLVFMSVFVLFAPIIDRIVLILQILSKK
jgi:hypothetical protein